ncbi:undecaprenyl/decaprenyl-phosphate alpha-N-acetylglucosaminyl 1-phosphate transferase [Belliella sp. DSM 107340]|uniref:Undecaprenyl/decaprenyl-phosphate alpha-N-acetylglucosaminyl 1-phosphate transferase n=1 Tax=Belliella calami TaxID=2923436 RepID=A0ABS9UUU5_9BACT|nr:MraY family glycosyltransferase [Belliella calami]MCH7400194.1 undecaprenyl/decaprenyl-phosphate alpha-N-acetylglucosaminyl 1-phosphate transferase [Belliella calami]
MLTVLSALFVFGVSVVILPPIISFLNFKGIGDKIDERRMHTSFIPTAGGLGVLLPALVTIFMFSNILNDFDLVIIGLCISMVFVTGLIDDLKNLMAIIKLVALIIPTCIIMFFLDLKIESFHGLFGVYEIPEMVGVPLTLLVIVFLTNAFNLIDGVDGLLSTVSSFVFMVFGAWFLSIGAYSFALISLAFLGGTIAFLVYNWAPARVFMGDSGSLSIGFAVSILALAFLKANDSLPIENAYKIISPVTVITALVVYPVFDTFRVFFLRIIERRSPFSADKKHIHHFLCELNFSARLISITLLGFNALIFSAVFALSGIDDSVLFIGVALFLLMCSLVMPISKRIYLTILREQDLRKQKVGVN